MQPKFYVPAPHPFPYQGSKRGLAKFILPYFPRDVDTLIEPFCGASAISLAVAANGLAKQFVINDLNAPLMALWGEILLSPELLSDEYARLWEEQQIDKKDYFYKVRTEFNKSSQPYQLLYLLSRIVKGAVRYSSNGAFNQSADNRRCGMHPVKMRSNLKLVSLLLNGRTNCFSSDYLEVSLKAAKRDIVYMDPPYQGTSFTRDHRYLAGLEFDSFVEGLNDLNKKGISFIISYDGVTGDKVHGKLLPQSLGLKHLEINAGRSSQATLLGNNIQTIESLYVSPALVRRLSEGSYAKAGVQKQSEIELI
jgi:DNA adenine methylase